MIVIHTDGSCLGNPGAGGWAAILEWNGHKKELFGKDRHTTNNKMELLAAIKGLEAINKFPSKVKIVSDSQYVIKGLSEWMKNWKKNNWRNSKNQAVANKELWIRLDTLCQTHDVEWEWVKGHNDHELNERCDHLAKSQAEKQKDINGFNKEEFLLRVDKRNAR